MFQLKINEFTWLYNNTIKIQHKNRFLDLVVLLIVNNKFENKMIFVIIFVRFSYLVFLFELILVNFQIIKMKCQVDKNEHFLHHLLFVFNRGAKAIEAAREICAVYGHFFYFYT